MSLQAEAPVSSWTEHRIAHYHPLDLRPVNIAVTLLVSLVRGGHAVRIVLEPGDFTRYEFLVVPLTVWATGTGHFPHGSLAYVPLQPKPTKTGHFIAIKPDQKPHFADFADLMDGHTSEMVARFFSCLLEELGEIYTFELPPQEGHHDPAADATGHP